MLLLLLVPNLEKPSTSDAPSNKKIENANLKSNAKSSNKSPPLISKDKSEHMENNNMTQTHKISSELNNMTMSGESRTSKNCKQGLGMWILESQHFQEGCYTLLGQISQTQMHKFEKEAKLQGKGSFAYAWALDESVEERERG
ncbi:unnamed protein product [Lactuca virosa]|uniref:Uncharacterized protein n=1 Tax=Lactuca virosa TaxID=75947 RepID=A0AAU9PEJ5_9ASTR|nr:unnamed protein product [Lactuca virosa]